MDLNIYPKCKELLRKDTMEMLQLFVASFPVGEDFNKDFITDDLIDSAQKAMLENNPRHLFDFFDKNNLTVEITGKWKYYVEGEKSLTLYNSRTECEKAAFTQAFKELESRL